MKSKIIIFASLIIMLCAFKIYFKIQHPLYQEHYTANYEMPRSFARHACLGLAGQNWKVSVYDKRDNRLYWEATLVNHCARVYRVSIRVYFNDDYNLEVAKDEPRANGKIILREAYATFKGGILVSIPASEQIKKMDVVVFPEHPTVNPEGQKIWEREGYFLLK